MTKRFSQGTIPLREEESKHKLKISKLMELVENHPYRANIERAFQTKDIAEEYILIDYIDTVHNQITKIFKDYQRFNIKAHIKDISLVEEAIEIEGISGIPIKFVFDEFTDEKGNKLNDLEAYAIYEAKNAFLNQYDMTKYANRLYRDQDYELVKYNLEYFRNKAASAKRNDKQRSYRLLEHKGQLFARGITSTNQYNEYGVDFAFVVSMLVFHGLMKERPGDNYSISSAAVSASKLELIIDDKYLKEAKGFGKVSSSTIISTNDLGNASFKFINIVKVGILDSRGFFIFPEAKKDYKNELSVTHNTKADNALASIKETKNILRSADEFIEELEKVKSISTPDELRSRILFKLENKNSVFKKITSVKDLFKPVIINNLENFSKLMEMCRKAEELDIDYDMKDKLRYIISSIILNKK